jgi:hypothetical protein
MITETNVADIRPGIAPTPAPSTPPPERSDAVQERLSLLEPDPRMTDRGLAGDDAAFLKAVMVDLEPDQKTHLATVIYDPTRAGEAAAIIATAGRTAAQTARVLHSVHFDTETIRDALLAEQNDPERPNLFPDVEVRAALATIASASDVETLMPTMPTGDDVARQLRDDRLDDLRLIQTAIHQNHQPARIAALAYGLDISPEQTIKVCATIDATPQRTMAIAIALRDGDGVAAFNDLVDSWPDIPGGWEQHAHPSMRATRTLGAVPDYNPTREILDQWAGRSSVQATPSPEPATP